MLPAVQRLLTFPSEQSKIYYFMGFLRGSELAWAEAVIGNQSFATLSCDDFMAVFDHPDCCAARRLNHHKGFRSVADFPVEYWMLAADLNWNDEALCGEAGRRFPLTSRLSPPPLVRLGVPSFPTA